MFYTVLASEHVGGVHFYVALNGNDRIYDPPGIMEVRKLLGEDTQELMEGVFECYSDPTEKLIAAGCMEGEYTRHVINHMEELGHFNGFEDE